MTTTTPNMSLIEPDVLSTPSPTWASLLNNALTTIDSHDHSTGKGVKITPSGMTISADLPFGSNNATTLRSVRFNNQSSFTPTANDLACVYVLNNEIYYRDGVGNVVQITSGGSLNTAGFSLSSLSIRDSAFTLQYFGDLTKQARFDLSLISTGTTRTYSLPNVSEQLVSLSATQILTNKDIDGATASNSSRITLPKGVKSTLDTLTRKQGTILFASDQNKAYVDNGTSLIAIGSGSSGLYTTTDFEDNTIGGIVKYNNGSVAIPTTGIGGVATSTFTVNSTLPLRGTYDGLWTKGAANVQGEGFSLPIPLSNADVGKTIQVTFDIKTSANFVSGDMVFYVYDITNSTLITPSQTILPTGTSSQYSVVFQSTTGTSYRLIWHVASTSALAYTVNVDQISYTSIVRPIVAGISDWISYTPTFSAGFGTVTNTSGYYKRIGDTISIHAWVTAGTIAASVPTISLPSGLTIDTSKFLSTAFKETFGYYTQIGSGASGDFWTVGVMGQLTYDGATSTSLQLVRANGSNIYTSANATSVLNSSQNYEIIIQNLPIAQWSSNITLASTSGVIEYQSNSSSTDANDTSSFVAGAAGSQGIIGVTAMTALRRKRVQFSTPLQPTDRIVLEISELIGGVRNWVPLNVGFATSANNRVISGFLMDPRFRGIGVVPVSGATNQLDVIFGTDSNSDAGAFNTAGDAWTNADYANVRWRVAKYSAIGGTELAPATVTSQGTVGFSQWVTYTPTYGAGFGTVSGTLNARYRREGDSVRIIASFVTGTVASSLATISLPIVNGSQLNIDTTKIILNSATSVQAGELVGRYNANNSVGTIYSSPIVACTGTSVSLVYFGASSATTGLVPSNGAVSLTNATTISCEILVPISGWN